MTDVSHTTVDWLGCYSSLPTSELKNTGAVFVLILRRGVGGVKHNCIQVATKFFPLASEIFHLVPRNREGWSGLKKMRC